MVRFSPSEPATMGNLRAQAFCVLERNEEQRLARAAVVHAIGLHVPLNAERATSLP